MTWDLTHSKCEKSKDDMSLLVSYPGCHYLYYHIVVMGCGGM